MQNYFEIICAQYNCSVQPKVDSLFNPSIPNIIMYILPAIHYIFIVGLVGRTCLLINACPLWWSFSLMSILTNSMFYQAIIIGT